MSFFNLQVLLDLYLLNNLFEIQIHAYYHVYHGRIFVGIHLPSSTTTDLLHNTEKMFNTSFSLHCGPMLSLLFIPLPECNSIY